MRRASLFVLAMFTWAATASPAWSYGLSPCLRVLTMIDGGSIPSQEAVRRWNRCGDFARDAQYRKMFGAVHEHMTLAAILEYRGDNGIRTRTNYGWKYEYLAEKPWRTKYGNQHETKYLIYGTWWNDDPLMISWGEGWGFLTGSLGAIAASKKDQARYDGGTSNCQVQAADHLGRASHRGRLQYLHYMTDMDMNVTKPQDRVAATTEKALLWLKFAYEVAIGEVKPDDAIPSEYVTALALPSVAKNHCMNSARVWTLFTRIGWSYPDRERITPDIALGSMFHVLQDSFSPAHTCRVKRTVDGGGTVALIYDVYNYTQQKSDDHTEKDDYPVWLVNLLRHASRAQPTQVERQHEYLNDPVMVGAWLLDAVSRKTPWNEVQVHLLATIFKGLGQAKGSDEPCI